MGPTGLKHAGFSIIITPSKNPLCTRFLQRSPIQSFPEHTVHIVPSSRKRAAIGISIIAIIVALLHLSTLFHFHHGSVTAKLAPMIVYIQPVSGLNDPRIVSVIILFVILAASTAIGSGISAWLLRRRINEQDEELVSASARIHTMDANQNAVLRAFPDLIFTYDEQARFIGYMTSDENRLALAPELFLGKNSFEVFGDMKFYQQTLEAVTRALAGEGMQIFEYELSSIEPERLFEARIVRLEEKKALSIARDITDRRRIEMMKDASIREKEALLKEIHHRVKNNMQIVSSLLSMQSAKARDDYDKELFIESQGRIRAMSAVHDQLYRSNDFTSIPAGEYLSDLVNGLEASWSRPDRWIRASVEADETALELELAVPIGLIVNELVTNSFKYAFGPGDSGTIAVSLRRSEDGTVSIVVSDNGHGFPEGFDASRGDGGMGYTIINALVQQIGGRLGLVAPEAGGSEITILVPPASKDQP